tara:strand:- start:123 stop:779 length:657 start_codon:yes stop_codon:yes gene_type:complete
MTIKDNSAELKALADKLDRIKSPTILIATIASKLDINWEGLTPRKIRGKIAKEILPDATKDNAVREQRGRVLAHANRAEDLMTQQEWNSTPLRASASHASSVPFGFTAHGGNFARQPQQPKADDISDDILQEWVRRQQREKARREDAFWPFNSEGPFATHPLRDDLYKDVRQNWDADKKDPHIIYPQHNLKDYHRKKRDPDDFIKSTKSFIYPNNLKY